MNLELSNYVVLTGVLIVVGLFLRNWQPPMKKQYIALILLPLGAILGHFKVDNPYYGFLIAGPLLRRHSLIILNSFFHLLMIKGRYF